MSDNDDFEVVDHASPRSDGPVSSASTVVDNQTFVNVSVCSSHHDGPCKQPNELTFHEPRPPPPSVSPEPTFDRLDDTIDAYESVQRGKKRESGYRPLDTHETFRARKKRAKQRAMNRRFDRDVKHIDRMPVDDSTQDVPPVETSELSDQESGCSCQACLNIDQLFDDVADVWDPSRNADDEEMNDMWSYDAACWFCRDGYVSLSEMDMTNVCDRHTGDAAYARVIAEEDDIVAEWRCFEDDGYDDDAAVQVKTRMRPRPRTLRGTDAVGATSSNEAIVEIQQNHIRYKVHIERTHNDIDARISSIHRVHRIGHMKRRRDRAHDRRVKNADHFEWIREDDDHKPMLLFKYFAWLKR